MDTTGRGHSEAELLELEMQILHLQQALASTTAPSARTIVNSKLLDAENRRDRLQEELRSYPETSSEQTELSSTGARDVRAREISHLAGLIEAHKFIPPIYTEMTMRANLPSTVQIKPGAQEFLKVNLRVFAELTRGFEDDARGSSTVDTVEGLLTVLEECGQAALLGDPGSGKSTTLQRLAYELAERAVRNPESPIPILVPLGSIHNAEDVSSFIGQFFEDLSLEDYLPNRVFLLLDGLNEMPIEHVGAVAAWLRDHSTVRCVVSCRKRDYIERRLAVRRIDVLSLDVHQIYRLIGNFLVDRDRDRLFWELAGPAARESWEWYKRDGRTQSTFDGFWSGQIDRAHSYEVEKAHLKSIQDAYRKDGVLPGLLGLMTNPLLLTSTIVIYQHNGEPPQNRSELFEQFVNLLIEGRGRPSTSADRWIDGAVQISILCTIAYKMLADRFGTGVREDWVLGVVTSGFKSVDANTFLYLAVSAGILEVHQTKVEKTVRFTHQLLQEYFAALRMSDLITSESASDYWPGEAWWEPTPWDEAVLLLAGILRDAAPVVKWLTPVNPTLAYRCARESGATCEEGVLSALYEPPAGARCSPYARAEWGRILANRPDPRLGVGVNPDGTPNIVWREVPAGTFVMGGDEQLVALGLSRGEQQVTIDYPYWMAIFPVTYAQFATFVERGYNDRSYWTDAGWRWKGSQKCPRYWQDTGYNIGNHPVVGVTWFESYAYTRWLDDTLHRMGFEAPEPIRASWEVSLPLEAEWERAARYPDDRRYPWGNEYVPGFGNVDETFQDAEVGPHFLRRTTAVGLYEQGKSHLGIYDLCGNVWEWCLSKWDVAYTHPENIDPEGNEHRGVRGGSWYNSVQFASAAAHDCFDADLGVGDVGFRLVIRAKRKEVSVEASRPQVRSEALRGSRGTQTYKVFVVGLPGVGKTEFVKSISHFPLVSIEKKIVSTEELVSMDYGRVYCAGNMVYFYAPASDRRIDFLWESIGPEMQGFILLVNPSTPDQLAQSEEAYRSLIAGYPCAHVIAITKPDTLTDEQIYQASTAEAWRGRTVLPCDCTSAVHVHKAVAAVIDSLRP